jgi:MYXO-CTERM domain-containing protein
VAAEAGTITNIGSYSVYLTADDGTRYDYLHMSNVAVTLGQEVQRGDVLGMVSNTFGGTPTTIHLHFNIRQNVMGVGTVYVPPYKSLINAYQKLLDRPIDGALEAVGCDAIVGWAFDPDDREAPVDVPMVFDGSGVAYDVRADVYRGDLCENLSFCEHGFDVPPPFSLFDGASHEVDATSDVGSLAGSPLALQCEPPLLDGARRPLPTEVYDAWALTAFWDEPPVDPDDVDELPVGDAFVEAPELWLIDDAYYVVDDEVVRPIGERALRAWRFDADAAEPHEAGELAEGDAWPDRPLVVRDGAGDVFVVDVLGPSTPGGSSVGVGGAGSAPEGDVAGGCSCGVAGAGGRGSWAWLLAAAVLAGRRRRGWRSRRG